MDRLGQNRLQVCFFSATLHSPQIKQLADSICVNPTWVDLRGEMMMVLMMIVMIIMMMMMIMVTMMKMMVMGMWMVMVMTLRVLLHFVLDDVIRESSNDNP